MNLGSAGSTARATQLSYPENMRWIAAILLCVAAVVAQSNVGELRVKVTDQGGLPIPCTIELTSQVNQVQQTLDTDAAGTLAVKRLPFGMYRIVVTRAGFAPLKGVMDKRGLVIVRGISMRLHQYLLRPFTRILVISNRFLRSSERVVDVDCCLDVRRNAEQQIWPVCPASHGRNS